MSVERLEKGEDDEELEEGQRAEMLALFIVHQFLEVKGGKSQKG